MRLPRIEPSRFFAGCLIGIEVIALAMFFRATFFAVCVMVAVCVGLLTRWRPISKTLADRLPLILLLLFALQQSVAPDSWSAGGVSFLIPDSDLIAKYFVVYQLLTLLVKSDDDRLPDHLPIMAVTAMIFAGDFRVNGASRMTFQILTLSLMMAAVGFFIANRGRVVSAPRRTLGHWRALAVIGTLCCVMSWASATGLYRYSREIEATLNRFAYPALRPQSVGFSGSGRIGSVVQQKQNSGDRVAIRVESAQSPGYLRGKVFDWYVHGQWHREPTTNSFTNGPGLSSSGDALMEIWPAQTFREVLFTPLGTTAVRAAAERLLIDQNGVVSGEGVSSDDPYTVWVSGSPVSRPTALDREQRKLCLTLPDELDPRIEALASDIVQGANSPQEKIAAVESFFLDHFTYRFGIDVPPQDDPIEYFLLNRPPAHCEFFASGAVILLRLVGVPCRYVTGLVSVERNSVGDYWVAHNRDAHAWVEAYDDAAGWVIVEPTPASGVPRPDSASTAGQSWDAARSWWQRMVAALRSGELAAFLAPLARLLIHPLSLVILLLVVGVVLIRRYRLTQRSVPERIDDPHLRELRMLLKSMDDRWRSLGLRRGDGETLHQFAKRLESADWATASKNVWKTETASSADWYRRFAAIRFGGRLDQESVELLRPGVSPKLSSGTETPSAHRDSKS